MELLLNLAWLLLAVPAYWVWRQDSSARGTRRVTSMQCVLALGCALLLLFPVISASDDLHAMRAEMEESAASKRASRGAGADKASAWPNRLQEPALASGDSASLFMRLRAGSRLEIPSVPARPILRFRDLRTGRAPPFTLPG